MVPPVYPMLAAIGAKLIGPHGGLQVDKQNVGKVTAFVDSAYCFIYSMEHVNSIGARSFCNRQLRGQRVLCNIPLWPQGAVECDGIQSMTLIRSARDKVIYTGVHSL